MYSSEYVVSKRARTMSLIGRDFRSLLFVLLLGASGLFTASYAQFESRQDSGIISTPQSSAPMLPGATNGTIGPPGLQGSMLTGASPMAYAPEPQSINVAQADPRWIVVGVLGLLSIFVLIRRYANSLWKMGAVAASVILVAGLVWGFCGRL